MNTTEITKHDARAAFLASLAGLLGCQVTPSNELADGVRPDVVAVSLADGIVFFGEAKDSESPGEVAVQVRLFTYLRWMAAHVAGDRLGILALCFARLSEAPRWTQVVQDLAHEVELDLSDCGVEVFDDDTVVAWFLAVRPR